MDNGPASFSAPFLAADLPDRPMPAPASSPTAMPPAQAQVAGTAAFSKFMHVLQLVADAQEPVNVAALMRASGYPRPTVHRIVAALIAEGLLVERLQGGTLALGPRLIQLASRSWGRSELRLAAVDELKRLRDQTGETVHLAVPNGASMVYIEKLESPSAVRMASRIGTSVSLHATAVGKAYMAALDDKALKALMKGLPMPRYTGNTMVEPAALLAQIGETRARGWSVDNEENEAGIFCFGAVIRGATGVPVAAISVSTLVFRQKEHPEQAYAAPLLEACHTISERIAQTPSLADGDAL
jgi:DNA-binding IclR family transcriptional regulator